MTREAFLVTVLIALLGLGNMTHADVFVQTASIGNTTAMADVLIAWSSVGYAYHIDRYEAISARYLALMNGVGEATITCGLWNERGGITNTGVVAAKYSVADSLPGVENYPVIYVNWYDTMRFASSRLIAWAQAARSRAGARHHSTFPIPG